MTMPHRILPLLLVAAILTGSCQRQPGFAPLPAADSLAIVTENLDYRARRESFFLNDPSSPFNRDTAATFTGIRWYPVNPRFRGYSVLHRYNNPEAIDVAGTGGEVRKQLRYGYFEFEVPDSSGKPVAIRLHVYKQDGWQSDPRFSDFLSIWFTDETTGRETYGVGRYVDIEREQADRDHVYMIDLNMAYNPFCAYSDLYSCAVPTENDHIPAHIRAGEMAYHD